MAKKTLTTDTGVPVSVNQNNLPSGQRGPAFFQDACLVEKQEMTL